MTTLTYISNVTGEKRSFVKEKMEEGEWEELCRKVQALDVAVMMSGSQEVSNAT